MTEIVLAIDPGGATGWSQWIYDPEFSIQRVDYGLIPGGVEGFNHWLISRASTWPSIDHVICESWRLAGDAKNPDLEALEVIGALKLQCLQRGVPEPHFQHRSDKAQVSDEKLKEAGLWLTGLDVGWTDGRDVNDSAIHAILWAKLQDHLPTIEKFFPEW